MQPKEIYLASEVPENDLPIFHQSWWLDIVCKDWDAVVLHRGNTLCGLWPYATERRLGIAMSRTPPLTPYMGPYVLYPQDLKQGKRDKHEHEVIREMMGMLPGHSVWNVSCLPGLKQLGLFKEMGYAVGFRQTFLMDLDRPEEEIFADLHTDLRRSVRKAYAELTVVEEGDKAGMLYGFQRATLERKGSELHYPQVLFERLVQESIARNAGTLWVARKDSQVEAILWNIWDGTRAYYLVGAKNPEVKDNHAMTMLIWHAIAHSRKLGKKTFDFEGSMVPGVERFFRTFGARRELYAVLGKNKSMVWKLVQQLRR